MSHSDTAEDTCRFLKILEILVRIEWRLKHKNDFRRDMENPNEMYTQLTLKGTSTI